MDFQKLRYLCSIIYYPGVTPGCDTLTPKRETCDNIFIFEGITPMALKAFDQYVPIRTNFYVSRLPDARNQAEANPGCVLGVAG